MPVKRFDPPSSLEMSYLYDDFAGLLYNSRIWSVRGGSGTLTIPTSCLGGQAQVRANASNYYEMYQSVLNFTIGRRFDTTWRVKLPSLTSMQSRWGICGSTSTAEMIGFRYDSSVSANWYIMTTTGSTTTATNTGVAADTNWHEFHCTGYTGIVTYFIDNVPVGNITTNIPTGSLSLFCRSTDTGGATKDTLIDWVEIYGDRV